MIMQSFYVMKNTQRQATYICNHEGQIGLSFFSFAFSSEFLMVKVVKPFKQGSPVVLSANNTV